MPARLGMDGQACGLMGLGLGCFAFIVNLQRQRGGQLYLKVFVFILFRGIHFRPIIKIKPPIWFAFSSVFFVVTMSTYFNMLPLSRLEYE